MNSVAVSNVATLESKNFSPAKANGITSKGFDAVLDKTLATQGHHRQEKALKSVKSTSKSDLEEASKPEPISDKKEVKVEQNTETSQTKEVTKEEVVKEVVSKEEVEDIEKEVIENIASILGISEEKLSEIMSTLNLTFVDLFSNKGLQKLFSEAFGLTNEVDLLINPDAFEAFKEIRIMLTDVLDERGIDLEDLKLQFEENQNNTMTQLTSNMNNTVHQNQTSSSTSEQVEASQSSQQNITVEVVDTRENKGNTEVIEVVQVVEPKEAKSDGKESKNDSNFQSQFENLTQPTVSHKVDVVTAQGIKEIIYQTAGAKEIMNQVVTGVKIALTDSDTTMTFQLKPENLGKVAFSITSQSGVLTGHFVAESSAVKEAIEANLMNLKATLIEQGIKLDEVKVVIGNTNQFFEQNDQSKNANHFNKNKRRKMNDHDAVEGIGQTVVDLKEAMRRQELETQERMVDFSA